MTRTYPDTFDNDDKTLVDTITPDLGQRICTALSLDPNTVTRLVIDIDAGSTVTVAVTKFVYDRELDEVINTLEEYELTPKANPS